MTTKPAIPTRAFQSTALASSGYRSRVADPSLSMPAPRRRRVGVAPSVAHEVVRLAERGMDVSFCDPNPRYFLENDKQDRVIEAIAERVREPHFVEWLFDADVHPAGRAWWGVAKRAVALHTLYHVGHLATPAEGIEMDVFDQKLFKRGHKSALDLIYAENTKMIAERIVDRYRAFVEAGSLQDGEDEYGLTSYDYLLGVTDSHAVRTRADAAKRIIVEHFTRNRPEGPTSPISPISTVSFACGAAGPIFELMDELPAHGIELGQATFVDHDPMALAATTSLARSRGRADRLRILRKNFLKTPATAYVEPRSVDVVDLIGVFEHIPATRAGYRLAGALLHNVAQIVRPGGLIVLGNMVQDRRQQEFFDSVWPRLQQRTIGDSLSIFAEAGFAPSQVTVRVPAQEGIYAVYGIEVPEHRPSFPLAQRLLGRALMAKTPSY